MDFCHPRPLLDLSSCLSAQQQSFPWLIRNMCGMNLLLNVHVATIRLSFGDRGRERM